MCTSRGRGASPTGGPTRCSGSSGAGDPSGPDPDRTRARPGSGTSPDMLVRSDSSGAAAAAAARAVYRAYGRARSGQDPTHVAGVRPVRPGFGPGTVRSGPGPAHPARYRPDSGLPHLRRLLLLPLPRGVHPPPPLLPSPSPALACRAVSTAVSAISGPERLVRLAPARRGEFGSLSERCNEFCLCVIFGLDFEPAPA